MKLEIQDLEYYVIPGDSVKCSDPVIYREVYAFWKSLWSTTITELTGQAAALNSDGFTRQTRIGALYHQGVCVGMTSQLEVDMSYFSSREDSQLKAWTAEAYEKLLRDGPRVSICSYLSVGADYRRSEVQGTGLKYLVGDLGTRDYLDMGADVMTGTMRLSKGTDGVAYASGGTFLGKSAMYGQDVDLVGFYRRDLLENRDFQERFLTRTIWNRRHDLHKSGVSTSVVRKSA